MRTYAGPVVTTLFLISSFLLPHSLAHAQSVDRQALLVTLVTRLLQLEQRLIALGAAPLDIPASLRSLASFPDAGSCLIEHTVGRGSRGADVFCLQEFLVMQGFLSADNITGYFGARTEAAVQYFQAQHRIVSSGTPASTGYGLAGKLTRARIALLRTSPPVTVAPEPPTTPRPPSPAAPSVPTPPTPPSTPRFPADRAAFVRGTHTCVSGREPSTGVSQTSLETVFRGAFFADDAQAARFDDQTFADKLYRCVLYREPDATGLAALTAMLSNGTKSRYELFLSVISMAEFTASVAPTLTTATGLAVYAADDPTPIGPYATVSNSAGASWSSSDKVLMTPFFLWYNALTGTHMTGQRGLDELTDHPVSLTNPPLSWASTAWWRKELSDISSAGIDVVLPLYSGYPGGVMTLVQTLRDMDAQGQSHPKVGMFYDTLLFENNPLQHKIDLRTDADRAYFYRTIRDYYSMIPPQYRAQIDGKPIVVLFWGTFAAGIDQGAITYVQDHFRQDFGTGLYIIRDTNGWNVTTDSATTWGAAVAGPSLQDTVQIGPGYDQSALAANGERPAGVVSREAGAFYIRSWLQAIASGKKRIIVETWNELHEGSDIAESKEYGRQYIDLTRTYAAQWRAGASPRQSFFEYLYRCILGRGSDSAGMNYFMSLPAGTTFADVYAGFYGSSEFAVQGISSAQLVPAAYSCILGRGAAESEVAYWVPLLASGVSRAAFARQVATSSEFITGRGAFFAPTTGLVP